MENLHDWINSFILVIIGVFVFIQNNYVAKMKSFIDIFDLEKVKKYVAMREESIMANAEKLVADNEQMKDIVNETVQESASKLSEVYKKQMGEEHSELINFAIVPLMKHKKNERDKLIKKHLPKTSRYMIDIYDNVEKNNALQCNKTDD